MWKIIFIFLINAYRPSTLVIPPFKHTLGYHRASKFYLKLYLGSDFEFKDPQGIAAVKLKELDNPKTTRDDDDLTLFAVHSGACEIVYNVGFIRLARYGKKGSGIGEFLYPRGICANPDGDIYIADTGNNRIVHLKYKNGKLEWIGTIEKDFKKPRQIAMDSEGNLYITDTENDRVVVISKNGEIKFIWERDLNKPDGIAVIDKNASYNYYHDDYVVIIDNNNKRIQQFNRYGKLLRRITYKEMGLDDAYFAYCAIDYYGNIWVTDSKNHMIHKFDNKLHYIISLGKEGTGDYEFYSPRGISIWRRFGQVFIVEKEGGQYYWIGVDGYIVGCFPDPMKYKSAGTTIALYLTETAEVKMEILDEEGNVIRKFPKHIEKIGEALIVWDGRDSNGEFVEPGEYTIRAIIRATYASRRYFKKELKYTLKVVE